MVSCPCWLCCYNGNHFNSNFSFQCLYYSLIKTQILWNQTKVSLNSEHLWNQNVIGFYSVDETKTNKYCFFVHLRLRKYWFMWFKPSSIHSMDSIYHKSFVFVTVHLQNFVLSYMSISKFLARTSQFQLNDSTNSNVLRQIMIFPYRLDYANAYHNDAWKNP